MKKVLIGVVLLVTVWACEEAQPETEANMRVNYYTQVCQGLYEGNCLLVQLDAQIGTDEWELFYYENGIQGFEYEAGYVYDLKVEVIHIPNPPQDGSSLEYKLIEVLSKSPQ